MLVKDVEEGIKNMNYAKAFQSSSKKTVPHGGTRPRSEEQQNLLAIFSRQRNAVPKPTPKTRVLRPVGLFIKDEHTKRSTIEISNKLSNFTIHEETIENKKERLQQDLKKCESPFKWKPVATKTPNDPATIISRLQEKHDEFKEKSKFKWRKFIIKLVICYELYNTGEVTKASEKLHDLELTLRGLDNCREWPFICIKDALWHIIITSKTFLYLEQNLVFEAEKLIVTIYPVDMMSRTHQAGIYGIKAAVFMEFGHRGNVNGLVEAMKATERDPSNAEWHFLVGKCMGRVRRVAQCHELVDPLEVKAFNKAHSLEENNPSYKVYLAQVLREKAFRQLKIHQPKVGSGEYKQVNRIFGAAKYKYLEAKALSPDCPHMLTRCAFGMCKMPTEFVEFKIIRECLDKAIELAPNNMMTHHVNALFYERFYVDEELAVKEMEKAASMGNFGAAIDLVRMHYRLKKTNIVEELEEIAVKFEEPCNRQVAYAQAGSYLLFIKKDIVEAIKYYTKVVEMDPDSYALKSHKPIFLMLKYPVNMFEVLSEELKTKTDLKSFNSEDGKILRKYMIMTRTHTDSNKVDCKKEKLNVEKILEMSICRNENGNRFKVKYEKWKRKIVSNKRWQGKKKKKSEDKTDSNKKENSNNNQESFYQSKEKRENSRSNPFGIGRCNMRSEASERNKGNRTRTNSISSVSSVDSDYQRDSTVFGSRSFFNEGSTETLNDLKCDTFSTNRDPLSYKFRDMHITDISFMNPRELRDNVYSRDCSMSSNEHSDSQSIDLGFQKAVHVSRYSQSHASTTNPPGKESNLTSKNLKEFDSLNSNFLGPRRSSVMSVSARSDSQVSGSESLSVMERVKQSYRMLSYKSNSEQNKKRSESSQNLSSLSSSFKQMNLKDQKKNFQRSGSTQSLNTEQAASFRNRVPDGYKPKFLSRDSSGDSCRSQLFMPKFGSK